MKPILHPFFLRFKTYFGLLPCAFCLAFCAFCLALTVSCVKAPQDFYHSSKPLTRWWWFASEIKKEDVADQLDWLKKNGFGGVEVAWVYPLNRMKGDTVNITPRQKWLSPEWIEIVRYCKEYADSLGLSVDFTFGSLWPFGDLDVKPDESTRIFGQPGFRQWIRASWDYPKKGLVLDHLNRQAFEHYASRMGKALMPALSAGRPSGIFVDSWEVETRDLWTAGFDTMFSSKYGYDITPFMQSGILSESFTGPRYDYMKLVSELVINNFYRPFTGNAHELGGFSRGQCSGSPTDIITAYASLDVPESEAMLYEPYFTRIAASAAALVGREIVSAETFTCLYGWPREYLRKEKVTDLKLVADALFAHGLNQVVWHGTPFNPKGSDSISFYASVHVGKAGALSHNLPGFNRYLETVSSYMRKGEVYSGPAIYLPIEDAWIKGEMPKEKQLPWAWGEYEFRYQTVPEEIRGYQPLWINGEFLQKGRRQMAEGRRKGIGNMNKEESEGIRIKVGDCEFNSLYVDAKYLDYEVLKKMTELAEGGFPVCVKQKPTEAGYIQHTDFKVLAERLMKNSSPDWLKVAPAKPLVEGDDLPWFWCRKNQGKFYIFFAHPVAKEFRYPVQYGQADTGGYETRNIRINLKNKTIPVALNFKPFESLLLEVGPRGTVRFINLSDFN